MPAGDPRPTGDLWDHRPIARDVGLAGDRHGEGRAEGALDGERLAGQQPTARALALPVRKTYEFPHGSWLYRLHE